ncbi:helix-turn-helix domain-containing protein [Enterobacter roggenkampii]|uniref:IprA winged helix-turn-helix domain-containing protein n=1 Tax=Enterobacter roggenkampii TaxID=1812935 RepID=A0AAQ1DAR1_9ENTR|nr:helix-turn-helix domain-containing protein [Enterobacter roggenkampii]QLU34844.1 helix-turn-helix domain-containing protein [Enterobacter cloacae]ELJ5795357.1 helix-turn-helix domain-containing protein [Enterobacter roggenkampii]KLP41796.1 cAMP-binding protein [Enterobacter roggenkampii]MBG0659308.1 helix-turn-helix domain-containing protein [Enterobacter roggenkampii]MBG0697978.1 helix-turn-helix domain-containing protein [Enterobacter roggenkampii]
MLSIYGRKLRPYHEIEKIISATEGFEEKSLKKWQKISTVENEFIHIIVSGEVEFRRESDELCLFTLQGQCIFGLSSIIYHSSHMYGLVRSNTVVRSIPKDAFSQLMTEKGLWPELTKVLAWYICMLSKRDDVLVARSAYSVVREFLLEINELIVHHQRDINVYDYIQEYTSLARSTIIKILSDLKKGQYIVVEKGRLLNITNLPEKY